MTIETKFNVGDEVWTLNSLCEPIPAKVFGIMIEVRRNRTYVDYKVDNKEIIAYRREDVVFRAKEELLKSLYYEKHRSNSRHKIQGCR